MLSHLVEEETFLQAGSNELSLTPGQYAQHPQRKGSNLAEQRLDHNNSHPREESQRGLGRVAACFGALDAS